MKRTRIVVLLLVVLAGALAAILLLRRPPAAERILASGTAEATEARLGFAVPGRIQEIAVREGDRVTAGQVLARLDTAVIVARRDQGKAQVASAQALLDEMRHGSRPEEIRQGQAALDAARQRREDAERDVERTRRLHAGGAVSREALDKAALALDMTRAQEEQASEQMRLLEQGPRREKVEAAGSQLAQAAAAERALEAALADAVVVAPFPAVVTVRHREPGETVLAGAPVVTLVRPDDRWVRIYVREDRVGALRVGQSATITADTYPGHTYAGEVVYISPEAEFTPKSVQTKEERVKLVYAVKVRITGDAAGELKPGMPADVEIPTGRP